jgi:two-component system, OmpR family, catabolic regulation response regulator CreB
VASGLRVLIVEDELAIAETLAYALKAEGFETHHVTFGARAITEVERGQFDFVILDVGLPDMSGFEVCKAIRLISNVPVLFLTARGEEIDRVVGLEIGGDDYVTKPFSPREVVARAKVIVRRGRGAPAIRPTPASGKRWFIVESERARILFSGTALELTRAEFDILSGLLRTPGRVYSRSEILAFVSDEPGASLERTVDVHIKTLRAKLRAIRADVEPIETHRGFGYSIKSAREG